MKKMYTPNDNFGDLSFDDLSPDEQNEITDVDYGLPVNLDVQGIADRARKEFYSGGFVEQLESSIDAAIAEAEAEAEAEEALLDADYPDEETIYEDR